MRTIKLGTGYLEKESDRTFNFWAKPLGYTGRHCLKSAMSKTIEKIENRKVRLWVEVLD